MFCSLQSKHEVKDKDQLLKLIRRFPEGMPVIDLKDAYPTVMDDLQVLIYLVSHCFHNYKVVHLSYTMLIIIGESICEIISTILMGSGTLAFGSSIIIFEGLIIYLLPW